MRIRSVKPDFWRDELTGEMPPDQALFYLGLCCFCDDEGRFPWNSVLMAADLDPYAAKWGGAERVAELLEGLRKQGRVVRFQAEGKVYGWMPSFKRHQKPTHPTQTRIPAPPGFSGDLPEDSGKPLHGVGDGVGDGIGGGARGGNGSDDGEHCSFPAKVVPLPKGAR